MGPEIDLGDVSAAQRLHAEQSLIILAHLLQAAPFMSPDVSPTYGTSTVGRS